MGGRATEGSIRSEDADAGSGSSMDRLFLAGDNQQWTAGTKAVGRDRGEVEFVSSAWSGFGFFLREVSRVWAVLDRFTSS